jgi:hypothetical protein
LLYGHVVHVSSCSLVLISRTGLNHVLHEELPCDLGKALGRSPGLENQRMGELDGGGPAAAAGARVPAIAWLGLINKRLGEVL